MVDLSNEIVLHQKTKQGEYIQFRRLLAYQNLLHAIAIKPLDFRNDEKNLPNMIESYHSLCSFLGVDKKNLIRPKQTHTDCIKIVDKQMKKEEFYAFNFEEVDGTLTNQKDLILSTVVADCIPLLFFDPNKKVVGAIHSGWKGTVQKIGQKAALQMIEHYRIQTRKHYLCNRS